jgi:hypothetical protein
MHDMLLLLGFHAAENRRSGPQHIARMFCHELLHPSLARCNKLLLFSGDGKCLTAS